MRRREFITLLGGATAWPLAARAQQLERVPRIGALLPYRETDTEAQGQMAAFRDELQQLELRNVRIDERWAGGDSGKLRAAAIDLVRLKSDVIITRSTAATTVLLSETRTIAVVFLVISDPVATALFSATLVLPATPPGSRMLTPRWEERGSSWLRR